MHQRASAKDAGQVIVFNGISKTVLYTRHGEQAGEDFGAAVAVANGRLFVGSPRFDTPALKNAGRVSVFNSNDGTGVASRTVDGSAKGDGFGSAITAVNDDWAVGIPLADIPLPFTAGKDTGSVQLFSGQSATPINAIAGPATGVHFGRAVNMLGDVNKDGVNDIAIGASGFDVLKGKDAGRVIVLNGAGL